MSASRLFDLLTAYCGDRVFNQYREVDSRLDLVDAAAIRLRNLRCYLGAFSDAHFILVGEAAGYAGCRFSGIPFTSEEQLVGQGRLRWTRNFGDTLSRSSVRDALWVEHSATIVWDVLKERTDCLLWNAFPWHPFNDKGPLSNRAPGKDLVDGLEVLRCMLSLFSSARPYAIGRVAQRALERIGVPAPYIRHPSRGGKRKFTEGVISLDELGVPPQAPHCGESSSVNISG